MLRERNCGPLLYVMSVDEGFEALAQRTARCLQVKNIVLVVSGNYLVVSSRLVVVVSRQNLNNDEVNDASSKLSTT